MLDCGVLILSRSQRLHGLKCKKKTTHSSITTWSKKGQTYLTQLLNDGSKTIMVDRQMTQRGEWTFSCLSQQPSSSALPINHEVWSKAERGHASWGEVWFIEFLHARMRWGRRFMHYSSIRQRLYWQWKPWGAWCTCGLLWFQFWVGSFRFLSSVVFCCSH